MASLLYVVPIVSQAVSDEHWLELLQRLAVLARYAAGALLIAVVLIKIRDA